MLDTGQLLRPHESARNAFVLPFVHAVLLLFWVWRARKRVSRSLSISLLLKLTPNDSLLYILAAGGYSTSVLKDLFCVPRPFSPPLVRLSTGKHGLEYGFPSTHSTTSISMCLFLCDLFVDSPIAKFTLVFLAGSVVFGRAYTGMHSMVDIGVGSFIGWAVYAVYRALEVQIEFFTVTQGWLG